MRILHDVTVGISQLHRGNIAHQDIKPSNVLIFSDSDSKIGDLGRSSQRGVHAPHDALPFAGDQSYAPPECLYGHIPQTWGERRLACDLYQIGSLIVFMYAGKSCTYLLNEFTQEKHRSNEFVGAYEDLLIYMQEYFRLMIDYVRLTIPDLVRSELTIAIKRTLQSRPLIEGTP